MKRAVLSALLGLCLFIVIGGRVARADIAGGVFTMTNATSGNAVLAFARDQYGDLSFAHAYPTGGRGTGAPLENAGGIVMSSDGRYLLVVNAGSDDVSVFGLNGITLRLLDREPSGGRMPISIGESRGIVYVLNAGGNVGGKDNISGFRLGLGGRLLPLAGSTRPLSQAVTMPAQVGFNRTGGDLVVTEKMTNIIDTYVVQADGMVDGPFAHKSGAPTPFGFTFDAEDHLLVADAAAKVPNAAGLSSYMVDPGHALSDITPFAPDKQTATCWVIVSKDGTLAFTTNTGSGTISGFHVSFNGVLTVLNGGMPLASPGPTSGPIDMGQSADGRFLYVLDGGIGAISVYGEQSNGRLSGQFGIFGLPLSADGLVAF